MTPYGGEIADLYDFVHMARGKNYALEAEAVREVARAAGGEQHSFLDIGCGTGHHLAALAAGSTRAFGVDLSEDMVRRATSTYPQLSFRVGDMRSVRLGETFGLVTCLFSSVGHMATVAELSEALATMRVHLAQDGICLVDPWWTPEQFLDGHVSSFTGKIGEDTVTRVSHSKAEDDRSTVTVDYLVTSPETGTRHLQEIHRISMFRPSEYFSAFESAGLEATFIEHDLFPRGLYVARHART